MKNENKNLSVKGDGKMNKNKLYKLSWWIIITLPILPAFLLLMEWTTPFFIILIPFLVIMIEAIFINVVLKHKGKSKLNVKEDKAFAFWCGLFGSAFWIAIIFGVLSIIKAIIEDIEEILNFIVEYRFCFILAFLVMLSILGVIRLFKKWIELNRKLAIKILGKKRVR